MQSITDLINSAILDPGVKGGLRWSPGKESSGDKYKVVRVWHIIANTYRNSSVSLEVKHIDRFDFQNLNWGSFLGDKSGAGKGHVKVTGKRCLFSGTNFFSSCAEIKDWAEISVSFNFQEENVEASSISEILKEDMQLIWDNFLSCERFLTGNCIVNQ